MNMSGRMTFIGMLSLVLFMAGIPFLMYGIVMGLNQELGIEVWLSYLITGGVFVFASPLFLKIQFFRIRRKSLRKKVREYA